MYEIEIRKSVEKTFHKLAKKDPKQMENIIGKIEEIRTNPHRYKNLKKPLQHFEKSTYRLQLRISLFNR